MNETRNSFRSDESTVTFAKTIQNLDSIRELSASCTKFNNDNLIELRHDM